MQKKVIVFSLGGSLIFPDQIDYSFLKKFEQVLRNNYKNYKFVVVCGGGSLARQYISSLQKEGKRSNKELSLAGIRATRMNAKFMMDFFGKESNDDLPESMRKVKGELGKNKVVFCGALRYAPDETSDGTAVKLANYLKTDFVNLTNVDGLYSSNPSTHKGAKFISNISWKNFESIAWKLKYKPGQHFILDQHASTLIKKHKIKSYILGKNLKNLNSLLNNKKFKGTIIQG